MKRTHALVSKLDDVNLSILHLQDEIQNTQDDIYWDELKKPNPDYVRFIDTNLHGLGPYSHVRPIGEPVNRMSIVLAEKSIAPLIVGTLGPQEQYILTRVARVFEPIVSGVVIEFATLYLKRYKNETDDASRIAKLVVSYGMIDVKKRPRIHTILSLWDHFMRIQHPCHGSMRLSYVFSKSVYPVSRVFVYDLTDHIFVPLSHLDLYVIERESRTRAITAFLKRWSTTYGFHLTNYGLSLIDYTELCMLDMKRIRERVSVENVYVASTNGFRPLYVDYAVYLVTPIGGSIEPSDDLYAQRTNCVASGTKRFSYKESLSVHINRVKKSFYC